MKSARVQFTVRRLMVGVLFSGVSFWFTSCVWNREYTETSTFWCWPATRATYTRTYGDRILERLGVGTPHLRNWTPIPDPPPLPSRLPDLRDWIPTPGSPSPFRPTFNLVNDE